MIIEDLIRMAKPLLRGGMPARKILELVMDVGEENIREFYRHVFVVELPEPGSDRRPVALPMKTWIQTIEKQGKTQTSVEKYHALAAPFSFPRGGNPLNPQGKYGVPVYPVWLRRLDKKTKEWVGQLETVESTSRFLASRIERTPGLTVDQEMLTQVASALHERVSKAGLATEERQLGLVILVQANHPGSPYRYQDSSRPDELGPSELYPGQHIVPNYDRMLDAVWEAKLGEGASKGERHGHCSICGNEGRLVSSYSKSWPWALPEWNCPLPNAGDESMWVEGIALCRDCSAALALGGRLFDRFTQPLHAVVTRELFSPADDRPGKRNTERKSLRDLQVIRGAAVLLPLLDPERLDQETRSAYADFVLDMLMRPPKEGSLADRYLDAVVGFDLFLNEAVDRTDFRLTLVYFHGEPSRGDVHVRAIYEEVLPSTLRLLKNIARKTADEAERIARAVWTEPKQEDIAGIRSRYSSVPYLLGRAYGGAYLWDSLGKAFRREGFDLARATRNSARRMSSLAHNLTDKRSYNELLEEVVFYESFRFFLKQFEERLAEIRRANTQSRRGGTMPMRPWKEMVELFGGGDVDKLVYQSPEELGFACGMLLREFGRQYYQATRKDYLQHRVMTFGTDLSPEAVWKRGLAKVFDVAARYSNQIHLSENFRQRVGVTLAEFDRLQEDVRRNRDSFMAAFWSGYALEGYRNRETATMAS